MKPLRTKEDILEFAAVHAPTKACASAIREGRVHYSPFSDQPAWMLCVESKNKRRWVLIVRCNEETRSYRVEHLDSPADETSHVEASD